VAELEREVAGLRGGEPSRLAEVTERGAECREVGAGWAGTLPGPGGCGSVVSRPLLGPSARAAFFLPTALPPPERLA